MLPRYNLSLMFSKGAPLFSPRARLLCRCESRHVGFERRGVVRKASSTMPYEDSSPVASHPHHPPSFGGGSSAPEACFPHSARDTEGFRFAPAPSRRYVYACSIRLRQSLCPPSWVGGTILRGGVRSGRFPPVRRSVPLCSPEVRWMMPARPLAVVLVEPVVASPPFSGRCWVRATADKYLDFLNGEHPPGCTPYP